MAIAGTVWELSEAEVKMKMHAAVLVLLSCGLVTSLFAQQQSGTASDRDSYTSRTHALDQADSRAEKEAERMVSLPAERIILLLAQEPG